MPQHPCEVFFKDAETVDYHTRALAYAKGMERLAHRFPADPEATIFYAMALHAAALPSDQTCANQLQAAALLEEVFAAYPQHPGVAYYLQYGYDLPILPRGSAPPWQRRQGLQTRQETPAQGGQVTGRRAPPDA
jgi:hypothetical protein